MTVPRRRLTTVIPVLFAALVAILMVPVQRGDAQEAGPTSTAPNEPPFEFLSQTSFVPANGDYTIRFSGFEEDSSQSSAVVDVTLYTALEEAASVTEEPQDLFNRLPAQPVTSLVNGSGEIELTIPIRNSSEGDQNRILLPDPGVYPVVIEFRIGENTVQTIRTNLIRLPIDDPDTNSDRQPVPADLPSVAIGLDATETGFSLAEVNQLIAGDNNLPLVVVVDQSTIEQLESDDLESRAFIRNTDQLSVVISPGPGANMSALASVGQTKLYRERMERLQTKAQELGLKTSPEISLAATPETNDGAEALAKANITTLLSSPPPNTDPSGWPTNIGVTQTSDSAVNIVAAYPLPARNESVELWSHDLAAALTIDQRLSGGQPTFVFLSSETGLDIGPDQLQVLADGNNQAFIIDPIENINSDLVTELASTTLDVTQHRAAIELVVSQIATYETTHVDGQQTPDMFHDDLIATFDSTLPDQDRAQRLDRLRQDLRDEIQTLTLPSGQAVTVAAETVPVPLTIENDSDGSRQVRLVSDSDKVEIKQDGEILTIPPGGSSIDLDVEVRSLGVSPVQISLFTPDGKNRLASTRFEVRSTAIPGLGLLLCLLGAVLLAFWWYVHAKRRRNKKHDTQGGDNDDRETNRRQASKPATPTSSDDPPVEPVAISAAETSGGNVT